MNKMNSNKISLSESYPELAKEWHPSKNGEITPDSVTEGSHMKVWWKCSKGDDHEWLQAIKTRVRSLEKNKNRRSECLVCLKRVAVPSNCLKTTHPNLIQEWDYEKNNELKIFPQNITEISRLKVFWICKNSPKHKWKAVVRSRIKIGKKKKGSGCPYCSGNIITEENCLAFTHPELSKEWHPTKNGAKTPYNFSKGSDKKVWWKCPNGEDHEWEAVISSRAAGRSCPICLNRRLVLSNSLKVTHPKIASKWDFERNFPLTPSDVTGGSTKKVFWKCSKSIDHVWHAQINSRVIRNSDCPCCSGKKIVNSNSIATLFPNIAAEWHPTKNKKTPYEVGRGSSYKAAWVCKNNSDHEWISSVCDRASGHGCPYCNLGWTVGKIRLFVSSLLPHIDYLTPSELYVIFQQNGILNLQRKGKSFIQALKTGKFPKEELEKFVQGEPSLVDEFIKDSEKSIDQLTETITDFSTVISEEEIAAVEEELPFIESKDILAALDNKIISNIDKEAIEFFINSALSKIWKHAFIDEQTALKQLEQHQEGLYSQEVKTRFLEEYHGAKNLHIPSGYNFKIDGTITSPNLMQRFTSYLLKTRKRLGNWSGTGAGKTLSAILSSRVIDSRFTLICCPNNVIDGWKKNIEAIYPDSIVYCKDTKITPSPEKHSYLIFNYEFFQQPRSESKLKAFLANQKIDFIVIDEIHYTKQRIVDDVSKRKKVISALLSEAASNNDDLHVLGMSATPVINNLYEGKTLIELITGMHHDDLNTKPSVGNCIALYQKLVSNGIRWVPRYNQQLEIKTIDVDCSSHLEQIKNISLKGSMVDLEAVLTQVKIPIILENLKPKTIVYTHYLKDIVIPLKEAIEERGWKTAIFSGDDKSGLDEFIKYDADVLIASSCLGTGIDGLQHVCNRIIINTLPWTHAEFEQLKGRIYRQGQKNDSVDIIVPLTHADVNGERWSWCDSRWRRILFKKSIADAAVDGVIPEGHLRTPSQAYQDTMTWLKRLEEGRLHEIERHKIALHLSDQDVQKGLRKLGDFSKMNQQLNSSASSTTHKRFQSNPEDWEYYHAMYKEARKEWTTIPYKEAIKWCKARPHVVIGDFGCGEALLGKEIENKIYSFDHVAINEDVIACDMSHVPLDDESLDAAIFSLSLMGINYLDYIKEAHRCLKLDGHLWIAETTSRFQNFKGFEEELRKIGFDIVRVQEKGIFTFLRAIKSDRISYEK